MKLTKKHFKAIADIIWDANLSDGQKEQLAGDFADWLCTTNGLFNRERFIDRATGCN